MRNLRLAGAIVAASLATTSANASDLSATKIGTAALITPTAAQTFYGNSETHTFGLSGAGTGNALCTSSTSAGCPPEIRELARALKGDVDLIYDYIHNNIQTVWMFGVQKGALGALIDKSGTPFDQAMLMVELLRASDHNGLIRYRFGTVDLTDAAGLQLFKDATNIDPSAANSAQAACQLFANGGIPAAINGQTLSAVCAFGSAPISSVTFDHVWVRVNIGSTNYYFDPSLKPHTWKSPLNWSSSSIMGFTSGYALSQALIGSTSGTDTSPQGDAAFISKLSATNLNTAVDNYADTLLTYLSDVSRAGWRMEDVVGGGTITPAYTAQNPQRLTTLPYHSGSAIWVNAPDQYRARFQLSGTMKNINTLDFDSMFDRTFYVDEIYGRRLTVETDLANGAVQSWFSTEVYLKLDGVVLNTYANPPLIPNPNYSTSRGVAANLTLKPLHPYAAAADGSPNATGGYMNTTVTKPVTLVTSIAIVHGWGDVSTNLLTKWANERVGDPALPLTWSPCYEPEVPPTCYPYYLQPRGDTLRERMAASWLAQNTRAAQLNAALADSILQMHHVVGVVYGDAHLTRLTKCPDPTPVCTQTARWSVDDSFDRIDVDMAFSLTNRAADAVRRRGAIHTIAAASAALESSAMAQLADMPDTASTATRFQWGNAPPASEDVRAPVPGAPRHFQFYDATNSAAAEGLALTEGRTSGGDPYTPWNQQPKLTIPQVSSFRASLYETIPTYTAAGFSIVASQESFLGPGQRGGTFIPHTDGVDYSQRTTKQRGAAFVANRYVGGDPVEIAHVVLGLSYPASGIIYTKGGGGGQEPTTALTYDPSQAADVLKARFVDRSSALGVTLTNGSMAYTSPASLSIGNGGFPYELSAALSWRAGPFPTPYQPVSATQPYPGWTTNWHNSAGLSGSGMEAMGQSDIRAAVRTIAAFVVAQDLYQQSPTLPRDVVGVLTLSWWTDQIKENVLTVSLGTSSRQFLKVDDEAGVAQDQWILPGAGYATAKQTGERTPFEEPACGFPPLPPYAMTRGWNSSTVSFDITNTNGDVQHFANWKNNYANADNEVCGRLRGFRLTTWTYPYGMQITVTYGNPYDPYGIGKEMQRITGVQNNRGRSIAYVYGVADDPFPTAIQAGTRQVTRQYSHTGPSGLTVTSFTDPEGNQTDFAYLSAIPRSDTNRPVPYSQLWRVFGADNLVQANLEYTYDALGRVKEAKDAIALQVGTAAQGGRNPYQFLIADGARGERIDPLGQSYAVDYDIYGQPARYIDEMGKITLASFDGRDRAVRYVYPQGDCERFQYDVRNNVTELLRIADSANCDPNATAGNRLKTTATWHVTWNKPTSITTPLGWTTDFQYNEAGTGASLLQWAKRPSPDGVAARPQYDFTYSPYGRMATASDPDGVTTTNTYDPANENLTQTRVGPISLGIITQFAYNSDGDVTRTTDPRGNVVDTTYNLNRQTKTTLSHDGNASAVPIAATRSTYDAVGRPTMEEAGLTFTAPNIVNTWQTMRTVEYSPTGKPWKVMDADAQPGGQFPGAATRTYYDALDRPSVVVDPVLRQVQFVYCTPADATCAANQVRIERRAYTSWRQEDYATYTYGLDDQRRSVKDANGNVTEYFYDKFIRLGKTLFPDSSDERLDYDKDGFIINRRTRSGVDIVFTPDRLDRPVAKVMPLAGSGARTTTYTYTPAGRTDLLSDDTGAPPADNTIDFEYDDAGRIEFVERTVVGLSGTQRVTYGLDAAGNRTRVTWPDGYYVGYGYDALGRMTKACETGTANANGTSCTTGFTLATYAYNPLSQRTGLTYGNGASMTYIASPGGNLTSLTHDMNGSADDAQFAFSYTAAHQVSARSLSDPDYLWQATGTASDTYTPNNLNQYASVNGVPFSYDANGNLTNATLPDAGGTPRAWTFTYDAENRLLSADKSAGGTVAAQYAYDPLNRRVRKSGTGVTETFFLGDLLDGEIAEYTAAGALTVRYIPGPAIDQPIAMVTAAGARTYFHTDRQGSIIAMSGDGAATVEGPYTYDPYGQVCGSAGTSSCSLASGGVPFKFTGRRLDLETGLYYYRARYYCWQCGRFLQVDPIGYEPDFNLYAYVGNDPTNKIDPSGNCNPSICGSEGSALGSGTDVTLGDVAAMRARADASQNRGDAKADPATTDRLQTAAASATTRRGVPSGQPTYSGTAERGAAEESLLGAANAAYKANPPATPLSLFFPLSWLRGIYIHSAFAKEVRALGPMYHAEVSYKNGVVVPYGTPGSVRADAAYGPIATPILIVELKSGFARTTEAERTAYRENLPPGTAIDSIYEVINPQ